MLLLPVIMLLFCVIMVIGIISSSLSNVANGGQVIYNEAEFQDYANTQYAAAFGESTAYEDNILLVFLTNEAADGYYTIAWVGDNVKGDINYMFGDETSEYGVAVLGNINSQYYAYSLDSNLADVVDSMTARIERLGFESSFKRESDRSVMTEPQLVNYTELDLTEATVLPSLKNFTEKTGIPLVIVVEDMEEVFGKTITEVDWFSVVAVLIFAAVAIYMIVGAVRSRKNSQTGKNNNQSNGGNTDNNGGEYYNSYEYR